MTELSEAELIMNEIVVDYGLAKMADRAVARALAEALCAEQPNPTTIAGLRAALPPRAATANSDTDRLLARLDDEELALLESIRAKLDNRIDPRHHLLRLSALRKRCAMLEWANEKLLGELRRSRAGGPATHTGPGVDGDRVSGAEKVAGVSDARAPSPSAEVPPANVVPIVDNGLPGKHNRMAVQPQRRAPQEPETPAERRRRAEAAAPTVSASWSEQYPGGSDDPYGRGWRRFDNV